MRTVLIHHAANRGNGYPPGSKEALLDCVSAGVSWVEVDIIPTADGDFALLHDPVLEHVSGGRGPVFEKTAESIRGLTYTQAGYEQFHLGTLSDVVSRIRELPGETEIQLDLKPYAPLTPGVLEALIKIINPIRERVLVSTIADWGLRLLRRMDPGLRLGFDPLLYLDLETETPRPDGVPPLRVGAYGYRDDHPLAIQRWGEAGDYFAARAEALFLQAPQGATWYLNAGLLSESLLAGFDWIDFLHRQGSTAAAWTLDLDDLPLIQTLIGHGIDLITTNQAAAIKNQFEKNVSL